MLRPGFFFLACPDAVLLKHRIEAILADYTPKSSCCERYIFWADEGLTRRFWETLTLQNLSGSTKTIILYRAHLLQAREWDALARPLSHFNSTIFTIFSLELEFQKRNKQYTPKIPTPLARQPYWSLAQKKKWIWVSPGLDNRTITIFLKDWATAKKLSFSPGALEAISHKLYPNAGIIEQELAKIELSLTTNTIPATASELISLTPEMEVFTFIDALQRGALTPAVWKHALGDESSGDNTITLFGFLVLLAREIRILWQLYFNENPKGVPPFLISTKRTLARSLGPDTLARLLSMALDAEYGVKSGAYSPEQATELLVANLTVTFAARQRKGESPPST